MPTAARTATTSWWSPGASERIDLRQSPRRSAGSSWAQSPTCAAFSDGRAELFLRGLALALAAGAFSRDATWGISLLCPLPPHIYLASRVRAATRDHRQEHFAGDPGQGHATVSHRGPRAQVLEPSSNRTCRRATRSAPRRATSSFAGAAARSLHREKNFTGCSRGKGDHVHRKLVQTGGLGPDDIRRSVADLAASIDVSNRLALVGASGGAALFRATRRRATTTATTGQPIPARRAMCMWIQTPQKKPPSAMEQVSGTSV